MHWLSISIVSALLAVMFLHSCQAKYPQLNVNDKYSLSTKAVDSLPRKFRKKLMKNFSLIKGGSFISGEVAGEDTFSSTTVKSGIIVTNVFIAKHEVSVADYMEFYKENPSPANKPDTLCFIKDFNNGYAKQMTEVYFWHPKYRNYPVSGINLNQAQRYCAWKTKKINKALKKLKNTKNRKIVFRLPTSFELEYIISKNIPKQKKGDVGFPFTKILKKANTKGIIDKNALLVIDERKDGFLFTSPSHTYKHSVIGLYNIFGNVAEWTNTPVNKLYNNTVYDSSKLKDKASPNIESNITYNIIIPESTSHFARIKKVIEDTTYHVVKGGSFAHTQFYTQPGAFHPVKRTQNHSWLGFRLVMEVY